jgi:hypothetical protein
MAASMSVLPEEEIFSTSYTNVALSTHRKNANSVFKKGHQNNEVLSQLGSVGNPCLQVP